MGVAQSRQQDACQRVGVSACQRISMFDRSTQRAVLLYINIALAVWPYAWLLVCGCVAAGADTSLPLPPHATKLLAGAVSAVAVVEPKGMAAV